MTRVIKTKYYKYIDFCQAKLDIKLYLVYVCTHIPKKGLKWNVGNEKSIYVWEDNWIKPSSPTQGVWAVNHPQLKVSDFVIQWT